MTTNLVTRQLRRFLACCGYRVFGWRLGVNPGPTPRLIAGWRRRAEELAELEGGPIGLVEVSLGGVLAATLVTNVRNTCAMWSPW